MKIPGTNMMEVNRHMLYKKVIQTCLLAGLVFYVILCAGTATGQEMADNMLDGFSSGVKVMDILSKSDKPSSVDGMGEAELQPAMASSQTAGKFFDDDEAADTNDMAETYQMKEWEKAYLEYLDSYDDRDIAVYAFIYVDEDDIPELAVSSGWMLNSRVLTFHDEMVNALEISGFTVHYMERGNRLSNTWSHMWEGNAFYYTLYDGQWELAGSGKFYELDEDGNEVDEYIYEWNGRKVTEEEYEQKVNSVFPAELEEHQHPAYQYSYDELYSLLGGE